MKASKKRMTRITVVAAALGLIGGGAYAYWTLTGGGSGSATTGTVAGTLTVNQTSTISDLRPGGTAQTLSGDFDNTDTSPVYVASVTATVSSVTKAEGAPAGTCTTGDYTIVGSPWAVGTEVASGTSVGSWGTTGTPMTIVFNDTAANQDACQGATVTITYSTS